MPFCSHCSSLLYIFFLLFYLALLFFLNIFQIFSMFYMCIITILFSFRYVVFFCFGGFSLLIYLFFMQKGQKKRYYCTRNLYLIQQYRIYFFILLPYPYISCSLSLKLITSTIRSITAFINPVIP